ncbi:hypothetical protein, partial [Escherichia coli]|uniref:hypothetical protein n=2 Tax=Escherichia coli TaxID=562 RepID=UPI00244D5054
PQNDVTLKMPAFEWVHVQLHQQKGMISLSPPTICNSAFEWVHVQLHQQKGMISLSPPTICNSAISSDFSYPLGTHQSHRRISLAKALA